MQFLRSYIWLFFLAAVLFGCNTTQFLDKSKGEVYLNKNVIEIDESEGKIKNKSNLINELEELEVQQPNRKMFGVPRQYHYFMSQDTFDRSKIGMAFHRWLAKQGEPPQLLDTSAAAQSAELMQNYLRDRGYFYATVRYSVRFKKNKSKAAVTFKATPGKIFTIDTIIYKCKDPEIQRVLDQIAIKSELRKGVPVDFKQYDLEVARITKYLRDNGYAYFYQQYISNLEGFDSSNIDRKVSLKLNVLTPSKQERHKQYFIGDVHIFMDYDPTATMPAQDTVIDGIHFVKTGVDRFRVKPKTLASNIFFRKGELYNQEIIDNSVRQLGALGVFLPPTLRMVEDSIRPGVLHFNIYLTANNKMEWGYETSLNNTERQGILGNFNLIGVSFNPWYRNRNFLRGAELLVSSLDLGAEFRLLSKGQSLVNSIDLRIQNDLYLPRFTDHIGLYTGLRKTGLMGPKMFQRLRQRATSRISASFNMLKLLNNYTLYFANISNGYNVPLSSKVGLSVNHFGFDLVAPIIPDGTPFDSLLESNPALNASFSKQLITGVLFRDLTLTFRSNSSENGHNWFFKWYFDVSGLEITAANSFYNWVSGANTAFNINDLDFSHYVKTELEGRRYWRFGNERTLIARLDGGIAIPYYRSNSVPYIKQFFVGGPYSIRGWYTRELGPGLYRDPSTLDPSNRSLFYQAGDIKIEFNLEYKFLISSPLGLFKLYGATFLDGGNIWTRSFDASRPGSQFSLTRKVADGKIVQDHFVREIALSTGFGFRMDFNYFVLRLDLGLPIRNNYPNPDNGNKYWLTSREWSPIVDKVRYQLAIGYPF